MSCLHCHPHGRAVIAEGRGENCCCLTLSFSSSSLQKTTKYRNPIVFDGVPVITMQDVKMSPQTPKWAPKILINVSQKRPEQSSKTVTRCAHHPLQHTERLDVIYVY